MKRPHALVDVGMPYVVSFDDADVEDVLRQRLGLDDVAQVRVEVEQKVVLRVLTQVRVVELHDVGQTAAGRLGLALLPEVGEGEEGRR